MRGIVLLVIGCVCVFALCLFVSCSDTKQEFTDKRQDIDKVQTLGEHKITVPKHIHNTFGAYSAYIKGYAYTQGMYQALVDLESSGYETKGFRREFQLLPYPPKINYADDEP